MKKILFSLFVVTFALTSSADYLYWQVSQDVVGDYDNAWHSGFASSVYKSAEDAGAQIGAVVRYGATGTESEWATWSIAASSFNGDDYTSEVLADVVGGESPDWGDGDYFIGGAAAIDLGALGDKSNLSFFIELYRNDGAGWYGVARSDARSYGDLSAYITEIPVDTFASTEVWQGSGYQIPEPTSGMLVMLGLSLLGLRRKRV